jgi:hypothetical protein
VGSHAGAFLAVQAAQDQGLLNAEQADLIIRKVSDEISSGSKLKGSVEIKWVTNQKDCAEMVAKLKEAGTK